jgi:hypothetical protein
MVMPKSELFRANNWSGEDVEPGEEETFEDFAEGVQQGDRAMVRGRFWVFARFGNHDYGGFFPGVGEEF